jgi:hypothetical protein
MFCGFYYTISIPKLSYFLEKYNFGVLGHQMGDFLRALRLQTVAGARVI